jgi:hypothetical protein
VQPARCRSPTGPRKFRRIASSGARSWPIWRSARRPPSINVGTHLGTPFALTRRARGSVDGGSADGTGGEATGHGRLRTVRRPTGTSTSRTESADRCGTPSTGRPMAARFQEDARPGVDRPRPPPGGLFHQVIEAAGPPAVRGAGCRLLSIHPPDLATQAALALVFPSQRRRTGSGLLGTPAVLAA